METVQQNGRFTLFLVNSPLIYILFSMIKTLFPETYALKRGQIVRSVQLKIQTKQFAKF